MSAGILNTPFVDTEAVIKGDYENRGTAAIDNITEILGNIEKAGLRPYYYQPPMTYAAANSAYGLTNGAYSFLIEVPGLTGGDSVFARRVFAHITALKEILNYTKGTNGEMAKEVAEAREKVTLSAQKFDENTPVILQHQYSRHDSSTFLWNNPLVGSDATVRKADNITKYYIHDIAMKYRARPTAYVLAKDTAGIDKVLATLDRQGIDYYELGAGVTLNLKKYSGTGNIHVASIEIVPVATDGIQGTVASPAFDANAPIYDVVGRQVSAPLKKGIYIQNGRKFIVK
jgi:hypothetical protein